MMRLSRRLSLNGAQNGALHDEAAQNGADRPPTATEIEALGLRIQAVMADLFALQEQLKQRGMLADDWSPPSHTMQMPQPDAPVEEANPMSESMLLIAVGAHRRADHHYR